MNKEKLIQMLHQIKDLAGDASLVGTFSTGGPALIRHYNTYLKAARENSLIQDQILFPDLEANASMDDIGIAATLLAAYLQDSMD